MTTQELQLAVATRDFTNVPDTIPWETVRQLLMEQATDKNSSTFREGVTARVMGYEQSPDKLGYDVVGHAVEIKPQNIYPDRGGRLSGSGQFTDFTFERHEKYLRDGVTMGVSGFVDGELVFVLRFPYRHVITIKNRKEFSNVTGAYIHGEHVLDFHNLNKDAIWSVATAALQEVDRQLQAEKTKVSTLETQVADLLARVTALENN